MTFTSQFYTPPTVLTTVFNGGSNQANRACPVKDPLSSWLEVNHFSTNYTFEAVNQPLHNWMIETKKKEICCSMLHDNCDGDITSRKQK